MFARTSIAPILRPEQLRQLPGILKTPPLPRFFEFEGLRIPSGALTEISGPIGSGKTEWTLRFISSVLASILDPKGGSRHFTNTERIGTADSNGASNGADDRVARKNAPRVAWIEDTFSANPRGFAEQGVDLRHFLFVEGGKDSLWATHQVLRSGLFEVVILWVRENVLSVSEPSVELRKLQLSAEQAGVPLLLLSPQPRPSGVNWPVALQIAMNPQTRQARVLELSPRSEEVRHERRSISLRKYPRLHSA